MKAVLDTSAFLYLNDFSNLEIFTVSEVIEEIKDRFSKIKLEFLEISLREPSKKVLEEVTKASKKTGDYEKLSLCDLKVLALAKELNLPLITSDYNIQNLSKYLGIKFYSLFVKKIKKLIIWKKYCFACKKIYSKGKFCRSCGSKLKYIA